MLNKSLLFYEIIKSILVLLFFVHFRNFFRVDIKNLI